MQRHSWLLVALPALLCFGPIFIAQFQQPWLMVGGSIALFLFVNKLANQVDDLQKRIHELESKIQH